MKDLKMTLDDLRSLAEDLDKLDQAGSLLHNNGLDVTFVLTGFGTTLHLPPLSAFRVDAPVTDGIHAFDLSDPVQKAGAALAVQRTLADNDISALIKREVAADVAEAVAAQEAMIDIVSPEEGHDIEPPAPQSEGQPDTAATVAEADGAGGAPEAVSPPLSPSPVAPPEPEKLPEPDKLQEPAKLTIAPLKGLPGQPSPWSKAEDEIAIATAAAMRLKGDAMTKIGEAIAGMVQRPVQGVVFRLNHKLKSAIHQRHQELLAEVEKQAEAASQLPSLAQAAKAAFEKPPTLGEMVTKALREERQKPSPATVEAFDTTTPLGQHLNGLPRTAKWSGWTVQRDIDLLDLAILGWTIPDIAAELGLSDREVKDRFEILTAGRTFKRDEVLAALKGGV